MTENRHAPVIIIGSGPAGYTAAVYAARANLTPMMITGVEIGGQLMTTTEVDNWPGDDAGVMGPELMERMRKHAERFGTRIENDYIEKVDFSKRPFVLTGGAGDYTADAVITCSRTMRDEVNTLFGVDSARVVPNGIEPSDWQRPEFETARISAGISTGRRVCAST